MVQKLGTIIVLEQLKAATQIVSKGALENFVQEADRLFGLRNELNQYVEALHKKHPFGYSLYDLFSAYSQLPKGRGAVRFHAGELDGLTPAQLVRWQDLAEEMQIIGKVIGHPLGHPLQPIKISQYTAQVRQDAKLLLEEYLVELEKAVKQRDKVKRILKLDGPESHPVPDRSVERLAALFLLLSDVPATLLQADPLEKSLNLISEIATHGKQRDALGAELLKAYHKDILRFPAAQTLTAWEAADRKWFLPRWLQQNAIQKRLKPLSLTGGIGKEQIPGTLQRLVSFQLEQDQIDQATDLPTQLGFLWKNGDADWASIMQDSNVLIGINRLITKDLGVSIAKDWRDRMGKEWSEGSKAFFETHTASLQKYLSLGKRLQAVEVRIQDLLKVDMGAVQSEASDRHSALLTTATQWHRHMDELKDWYNWMDVRGRSIELGLQSLVAPYEKGEFASEELVVQFQKGLYRSAAEYIIERTPKLATFSGSLFEEKIRKFREISKRYEKLTRQELYARLAAKVPNFTQEASQSSEIGILQKAIRNNGRAMSIRKLFDSIPHVLPRLTPCMLMSPISVAQYFDADSVKFDLVIFDEASQMPTCEAVGAIARGTDVIVVGDPKQMPPTNFFSSNNVDEDNMEKEHLESILDDCLALSMPSQHLLWHYRSKHESLIAFSNAKYYDSKLLTFPSQDDITSKVRFVPVEGYYDKGKTRQNQAEAKAIVNEVVSRFSNPALSGRSIGIVTFSSVQQNLIEDLLSEVFMHRPDLEKIALESEEPLFVKNLENVQGDERDVILFSVGYGPDREGKVSLNFGPINREGGWRRLNVAVSRARYEMKVFSTLRHDQIDLNRTSSEGVAGLKAFLAYAEKGKAALPSHLHTKLHGEATLENVIASEIRKHGYEAHTHIGSSSFKIDIGIVDPKQPSNYMLAILTDGRNYHNAATSNDREIVQLEVLRMLGWNVHKIWSVEWWENSDKVLQEILEALETAKGNQAGKIDLAVAAQELEEAEIAVDSILSKVSGVHQYVPPTRTDSTAGVYEVTPLVVEPVFSSEEFLLPSNMAKIADQIRLVLETESPISKSLLCKRVLASWGISRLGTRISNHFEYIFETIDMKTEDHGRSSFFWKGGQEPGEYVTFRIARLESQKRDADDLPPEEVANGVTEVLRNQISLSRMDLVREVARLFGYARIGSNVEKAMQMGIDKSIERGRAYQDGDKVILAK